MCLGDTLHLILSFGQKNLNKIWKIKIDVLCNILNEVGQIECTLLFCHNKSGSLVVKELTYILGVQGSIPIISMGCGQWWDVDQIFPTYIAYL
jgi:hypothetical protein